MPAAGLLEHGSPSGATLSARLACDIHRQFDGLDRLREAWDAAVLEAGGSVYMTYDWVRVWWEAYGERLQLRLFVFSNGPRIVAIVPIYIDTLSRGPWRFRIARLVGANIPPKVFDPPVPEWCAGAVFAHVIAELFGRDDCDLLSVGPVSELHPSRGGLELACQKHANQVRQDAMARQVHSTYVLPADMEEYYSRLSQRERKNRRKFELRLLKKEHDTRVEVLSSPEQVSEELERFADQHTRQWQTEGRPGHFGAWPRAMHFNRALVAAQGQLGRVRFIRIVADDQPIATEYVFAFGDRYFAELPSRAVDRKWERFSLGPTSSVVMLGRAISDGMSRVESGLGHYDYKVRLGAQEHAALTFRIVSRRFRSRLRFAAFSALRTCVSVAYHKIWYRRFAPRLPRIFRRPQAQLWLRLDF
jgi:CelD/BcsL family acetyltransferase involved in cellulose biosynthesis